MLWSAHLLLVCSWIGMTNGVVTNHVQFKRYLELENKYSSEFHLSSSIETSERTCAETCKNTAACESFFYDTLTGSCELRDALFISPNDLDDKQGVKYYYAIKGEHDWCPSWKGFQLAGVTGPCINIHITKLPWHEANQTCENSTLTSRLVVVEDMAKQTILESALNGNGLTETCYIGLNEQEQDVYKWVDGSDVTFTYWHTADNSDPAVEDCVHMFNWKWVRNACTLPRLFMCEMIPDQNQYRKMMNLA